jgi:1-acyl-sn-glycerol-3-phosphate acyltransferase
VNTLRVYLMGVLATIRHGFRVLWASARHSPDLHCVCMDAPRAWSGRILRAGRVDVVLEGLEHIEAAKPAVLVCNHESWFDVFALAANLPMDYRFVAKKELASVPIFGPAWRACGHISIDRSDHASAVASLDEAGHRIRKDGAVVIMFPEGTRSRTAEMLPFKKGAFVLAIKLGVPVVPIGISGSRAVMPKGSWTIRKGTIRIRVGEPIPVEGLTERDRNQLLARAREAITTLRTGPDQAGPSHILEANGG